MIFSSIGKVAYRLDFPEELSYVHSTFHVSQLRKCIAEESFIIPLDDIPVDERLNYVERLVGLERKKKAFHNKDTKIMKVQWQHRKSLVWTSESDDAKALFRVLYCCIFWG